MKDVHRSNTLVQILAIITLFFSASLAGAGETHPFRVVFEDLPGTEYILAGHLQQGIEVLQRDLEAGTSNQGYVLATLRGAYVLAQKLG